MARQAGSKSTVTVNLSVLTERLARFGDVPVQIGKGWADSVQTALSVDFGIVEETPETVEVSEVPTASGSKVVVE